MKPSKPRIIQVREDDGTVVDVEVDRPLIDFYKKEKNRVKVTNRGLTKFLNHLVSLHF
jgi:hypothetical protein